MTAGLRAPDERRSSDPDALASRLLATRRHSLDLAAPLTPEDQVVQANPDASPTKWHLAHVTWFFETFLLKPYLPAYTLFDQRFPFCFNSYYEAEGARHPRDLRGLLTRPTHDEVLAYRAHVDAGLHRLVSGGCLANPDVAALVDIGIHHEQQHQELLLTDILSLFASQPLRPAYAAADGPAPSSAAAPAPSSAAAPALTFTDYPGGVQEIGHAGSGFSFDNESPRHLALLRPFALADRLVTNGEWLRFVEAGGYSNPGLWLADGWGVVKSREWTAPLYWERRDGGWMQMGLYGLRPLDLAAPVTNISFYEADAFARWAGHRLPTEFEWEIAAVAGDDLSLGAAETRAVRRLAPAAVDGSNRQMFGEVWQWTQSAYLPYPGYKAAPGAIGEYNGKFMCSQQVLRGSSCATSPGHARATYRNFFYPHQRWQFTGLRLASDR